MNHTGLLKTIQNVNGVHSYEPVPPMFIVKKKRVNFIHTQSIVTINNIDILDKQQTLLHIIHMESNNLNIVVTFILVYLQNLQNMFHYLSIIQHNNITLKTDLFHLEIWELKTIRLLNNVIIPNRNLTKRKQFQNMKEFPPIGKNLQSYYDNF